MPRELASELPSPLLALLDGEDVATNEGETLLLSTSSPDGQPRLALLSVGEVYAPSAREIRLALWPDSHTTWNLSHNGRALLSAILAGVIYNVEIDARREGELRLLSTHLARFSAVVRGVRTDVVGYAEITSGIRFRLRDRERIIARWEATIAALRDGPGEEREPDSR